MACNCIEATRSNYFYYDSCIRGWDTIVDLIYDLIAFFFCTTYTPPNSPGRHGLQSPLIGRRAHELEAVRASVRHHPQLAQFIENYYAPSLIHLIPMEKRDEADIVARRLFLEYVEKYRYYGCTEENLAEWRDTDNSTYSAISLSQTRINTEAEWHLQVTIERNDTVAWSHFERYLPPYVAAYHELMHVEECPAGVTRKRFKEATYVEALAALKTILLVDQIYKEVHGQPLTATIDYKQGVQILNEDGFRTMPLGELANFYRNLEGRYGKLYRALISRESIEYLTRGSDATG